MWSGALVCVGERCQWVLEVGWLLNTSWPGGLSRDSAARARACPVPAREQQVPGQSPEMCPWGRRSQRSRGDRSQRLAASSAVSSHHICFKACGALALWDTPWLAEEQGSSCCSPWASEDAAFGWRCGDTPLCLLPRHRFASTAVGAGCEGADGYSKAHPMCHLHSHWGSGV